MSSPTPEVSILFGITSDQTLLVLRPQLLALQQAGFSVSLLCSPGPLATELRSTTTIAVHLVPIRRGIAPLHDLLAFLRILRLLARLRPAMVDFSTPKAALLGLLAARLLRIPVRIHTLRGLRAESASPLLRPLLLFAERCTAACAHVVLCNSPSLLHQAAQLRIAPAARLRMLAHGSTHGVDLDQFAPGPAAPGQDSVRAAFGIPADALVLGYVGRLTRNKGIPELLQAFDTLRARHPQLWLLLGGWFDASEDHLPPALVERIRAHPAIVVTGFRAQVAPLYRAMDIFVLPTHREGFPNVALEAAASALPIVTTTATGACDAIQPGITGLLVPPGHPAALADAIAKLLPDPALRQQMGRSGHLWVAQHFAQPAVLAASVAFYQRMRSHAP